ncbi:hypothetical protein [Synechococcus sp. YX-04-1]|uniref:hypothetical protein n=1 Tax=unclassified Synechococcus TaxID=2626047 RepID=UPI0034C60E39
MGWVPLRVLKIKHRDSFVSIETNLFCRCLHDCFVDMGDCGMEESVSLSVTQQFDVERMNRAIESTLDPQQLQVLAKQLLQAWHSQRAATAWVTRQRDQLS